MTEDDVAQFRAGRRRRAAHGIAGRSGGDFDTGSAVAQGHGAVAVRADEVAGQHIARHAAPGDAAEIHTIFAVAGDDIAGARPRDGRRSADAVFRGAVLDANAIKGVGESNAAAAVGTNPIARDLVARRAAAAEMEAAATIAGNDVTGARRQWCCRRRPQAHRHCRFPG